MSRQTYIDQFFKVTSNKPIFCNECNIKPHSKFKSTPLSKNRRKRKNLSKNTKLNPTGYIDVHERTNDSSINNVVSSSINNEIEIIELCNSNDDMVKACENVINTNSINNDTMDKDEVWFELLDKESESLSNITEISLNNGSRNLEVTRNEKLKTSNKKSSKEPTASETITPKKKLKTLKDHELVTNSNSSGTPSNSPKQLSYSPKVPSSKSPTNTKKSLFNYVIDENTITSAIKHMNLARQGAISNNFNLEEIYSKGEFTAFHSHVDTTTPIKYKLHEVTVSRDLHSWILLNTVFTVFSNPINCGYFDENELDFIYSIITLPAHALLLVAHMLKRKKGWFRKSSINYSEITSNLQDIFKTLESRYICTLNIEKVGLTTILGLLQVDEIRQLCRTMKINPYGNKKNNISKLLKLSNTKPLFPGVENPNNVLYSAVLNMLDDCVCISDKTWNTIQKLITLLMPHQDPQNSLADTFFNLGEIYSRKIIYPNTSTNCLPIFSCNLHLLSYIKVKAIQSTTLQLIEKKNWKEVQNYGKSAMDILSNLLKTELPRLKTSILPIHVQCYKPVYIWLKVLSACIDAFKKDQDKTRVVEVLRFLLQQDYYTKKGKWYAELALIEMYHHKNVEEGALVILEALNTENLTRVDKVELIERANKILKRKTGLQPTTKDAINKVLKEHIYQLPKYQAPSITINAALMPQNTSRNKSIWCITSNTEGQAYGSVETLALHHYTKQEFSNGLHCEGALPVTLFVLLFWEELYDIHIPGTFATPYQDAPYDLFTGKFYENRKEIIDMKFNIASNSNPSELGTLMKNRFEEYKQYQSIMPQNLFKNSSHLQEIVHCLGVDGVLGICRRLVGDYKLWRAGFPDLIVWDFDTKRHKIIEVKGPRDTLSIKQQLWLEYLHQLGLDTEVCLVQAKPYIKDN